MLKLKKINFTAVRKGIDIENVLLSKKISSGEKKL